MDSERTDVIVPPDLPADELEAPKSEEGDTEQGDVDVLEHRAKYVELPANLAKNADLCGLYWQKAHERLQWYKGQDLRRQLEENLQASDAMWRASKRRDRTQGGEANADPNTLSNVSSTSFYRSHRIITTGQTAVIFYGAELPFRYEPEVSSRDYTDEEGKRIADGQNLTFQYSWYADGYDKKLKDALFYVNKDAHAMLRHEWEFQTQSRIERVPGYYTKDGDPVEAKPGVPIDAGTAIYKQNGDALNLPKNEFGQPQLFDENGTPRSYAFIEKVRVLHDHPCLTMVDIKDIFFDMTIDDMQKQNGIVEFFYPSYDEILQGAKDGKYTNVDQLSDFVLDSGITESNVQQDRDENADGQSTSNYKSGLLKACRVWLKAPIDDSTNRRKGKTDKTRGVWDAEKNVPVWYEAIFVGEFSGFNPSPTPESNSKPTCVCIMLRRNPNHHGRNPYKWLHSHRDNRGALHMGYSTLLDGLYEQECTVLNQYFDNRTLAVKRPWIGEKGNVLSRDLKFRQGNQVFWVKPGSGSTALKQLDVSDMTGTTLPMLELLSDLQSKTMGTDKAYAGEFAGSRTTGTEYLGVMEQAMKPAMEDARGITDQFAPWLLENDADLWRQYGDPEHELVVIHPETRMVLGRVNPAELYGRLKTRVVSIGQFETDMTIRQNLTNFIASGGYDKSSPFMGKEGSLLWWKTVFKFMKIPDGDKMFPALKYKEAENQAWSDIQMILNDPNKAIEDATNHPHEDENHDIHLGILEPYYEKWKMLTPKDTPGYDAMDRAFQLFIHLHKQAKEQQGAQQATQQQGQQNVAGTPPAMSGEGAGDTLSGMMGQTKGIPPG